MVKKALSLILVSLLVGLGARYAGLAPRQAFIISVYCLSLAGTLLFWEFRLSVVFIGAGLLILTRSIDLPTFIHYASFDVILFLIGMMILVGALKESGVFQRLLAVILNQGWLTGNRFFIAVLVLSALLSALVGEVTSMLIMAAVILDFSDAVELDPVPLLVSSVMATNTGSAATLLGNPIGILIALRGGLSFEDFLVYAFPLSVAVLVLVTAALAVWFRHYRAELSARLARPGVYRPAVAERPDARTLACVAVFIVTLLLIGLHRRLEMCLGAGENDLLIIFPIMAAGLVMLLRWDQARHYVEHQVEWGSLLFFIFLFGQAGVVQSSGIARFLADRVVGTLGTHPQILSAAILFSSGLLSSVLDNTVVVASFVPVINSLHQVHLGGNVLWWCLLAGACLGGNITVIGSTANIIAAGILEKRRHLRIGFWFWFKIGLLVGLLSMAMAWGLIVILPYY